MLAELTATGLLEATDELSVAGPWLGCRFATPGHAVSCAHRLSTLKLMEELLKQLSLNDYLFLVLLSVLHLLLLMKQILTL